ncbi:hypothetical protein LCGC14_0598990 [marine sediment metagenome]|uniref:Uncharacterized protein n=1 Tax=marine sediment metagenome TaxID=412755 RepID=A0A0F9TXH7_9ZZZZ
MNKTENYEDIPHECKSCGAKWNVHMRLMGGYHLTLPTYTTGLDTYLCPECKSENTIMFSGREKVNE